MAGKDPARAAVEVTLGTELKFARERTALSPEIAEALNSFAPERDVIAPPVRPATHVRLERDPFIVHSALVPLAPKRAARGRARRAVTVLALLGIAGWAAYTYEVRPPVDLDTVAEWGSRLFSQIEMRMTPPAPAPSAASHNDPTPPDSPLATNERATSPDPERGSDTGSHASDATVGEIARPPAARSESTGTAGSRVSPVQTAPVQNVSGEWRMDAQMEATDSSLEGLKLHYEMTLKQDGDRVSGVGTKISENEAGMTSAARTPVTMSGTIAGDRLTLNLVERGVQHEMRSKMVLLAGEAGTLRGRFSSNVSQPSFHVEAHRMSSGR